MNNRILFQIRNTCTVYTSYRNYAAVKAVSGGIAGLGKKGKKGAQIGLGAPKPIMEVEKDPHKLVNYVCGSNIMNEGEDVQLKPDSEYPEWLWTCWKGRPLTWKDFEPDTKEYYEYLKRQNRYDEIKLRAYRKIK